MHASVADTTGAILRGSSPMFNHPDGLWNHGEGFAPSGQPAEDYGGYHGIDDGSHLTLDNVFPEPPAIWTTETEGRTGNPVLRFVGYLRPATMPPGQADPANGFDAETAFEVFAPASWNNNPVVIVIGTWATIGFMPAGRNGYVGNDPTTGLRVTSTGDVFRPQPVDWFAATSNQGDAVGLDVVGAYIVSPIPSRDLTLTVQRTLQLERAVKLMLQDPSYAPNGIPPPVTIQDIPVVIAGSSAGGQPAQVLPVFYPDRFQGGVAYSYPGSIRRAIGEHETYTLHTSSCSFGHGSQAFGPLDTLQSSKFYRDYREHSDSDGVGFYEGSFLTLWLRNDPGALVQNPVYFVFSDEDTVTNGTPWATALDDVPGQRETYRRSAAAISPTGVGAYWSPVDRACHDAYRFHMPAALFGGTEQAREQIEDAVIGLARNVSNPGAQTRPDFTAFQAGTDHDVFAWVLDRGTTAARQPQGQPSLLTEDTAFVDRHGGLGAATAGLGGWLGHEGALVADGARVWVGSADGMVTRLRKDPSPGSERLTILGQCRTGGFRSLGYGVRGLAVTAQHVFATTHRRLYRFDKSDLNNTNNTMLQVPLSWEESRPRNLRVVDLWANGTEYLIYATFYGELVVRKTTDLSVKAWYSEPGIRAFVVGGARSASGWSRPIYLLSERGRVVWLELAEAGGDPVQAHVVAASANQDGDPLDIIRKGDGTVVALYAHVDVDQNPISDTIREFSADLELELAYSNVGNDSGGPGAGSGFDVTGRIAEFAQGYVVLRGGMLHYVTPMITQGMSFTFDVSSQDFEKFYAARNPRALVVVDIGNDGTQDVAVSTENGHLVWLPQSVVTSGDLTPITAAIATEPHAYSSAGVVATWGMTQIPSTTQLAVVDQTGRLWSIECGGATPGTAAALGALDVVQKPYRDLEHVGFVPEQIVDPPRDDLPPWGSFLLNFPPPDPVPRALVQLDIKVPTPSPTNPDLLPADWVHWSIPMPFWDPRPHFQWFWNGYVPFHYGGHRIESGGRTWVYWWSGTPVEAFGSENYNNLIQGFSYDPVGPQFDWWASAAPRTAENDVASHIRNVVTGDVGYDQQALRLGVWPNRVEPYVVVGTSGGGILVLDPTIDVGATGQPTCVAFPTRDANGYFTNELDHGYGGVALSVSTLTGSGVSDARPRVFFGTLHTHADFEPTRRDMVSSLHLYDWNPASPGTIQHVGRSFDVASGSPQLYGLCGIAVGEVDGDVGEPDGIDEELVLTTLNGDLVVFDLEAGGAAGVQLGALLHWSVHDGALGAHNSILIADLDGVAGNELYVASTLGVRKLTVTP